MKQLAHVLLTLILPAAAMAGTYDTTCGPTTFQVVAENSGHSLENKYELYGSLSKDGQRRLLFTSNIGGWLSAECVVTAKKRELLLFQAYCGGSACVEDKYGIVDPENLKLLLVPPAKNKGNSKAAAALLQSKNVPYLPESETAFCCQKKPQ